MNHTHDNKSYNLMMNLFRMNISDSKVFFHYVFIVNALLFSNDEIVAKASISHALNGQSRIDLKIYR